MEHKTCFSVPSKTPKNLSDSDFNLFILDMQFYGYPNFCLTASRFFAIYEQATIRKNNLQWQMALLWGAGRRQALE
ncbi:MAG TPA: hypothetical protein PLT87_03640 [Spirochaetales bacterium]|nr:hypothetical protein [Spirochaetales bacterium]